MTLKNIDFAIERGFRLFQNGVENFHFFMIQIKINKNIIPDGSYLFLLKNKESHIIYKKDIVIDSFKKRIITPYSHEDPLVEDENHYMICFQLEESEIKNLNEELFLYFQNKDEKELIEPTKMPNLQEIFQYHFKKYSNIVDDYNITTVKDCVLRLHLGDENGKYKEEEYFLKKGDKFSFQKYLTYPYLGVQCSYENESPEIEEKHILIGQKAMTLSCVYYNNFFYEALLPFNNKYQTLYYENDIEGNLVSSSFFRILKESWNKVKNIEELINFYKNKKINFFEIDINFLLPQYKNKLTYGLNKVVKLQEKEYNPKNFHIDLDTCKNCELSSKCIQIIPSNMSAELFRKNLYLENRKDCEIYQLIKQN